MGVDMDERAEDDDDEFVDEGEGEDVWEVGEICVRVMRE
jgi:hypothetical protein